MLKKGILSTALYWVFVFPCFANKQMIAMPIQDKLQEARDYLSVLPERSLAILSNKEHLLRISNHEILADWYDAKMIASIRVADLDQIQDALIHLSKLQNTDFSKTNRTTWLNGLGIWMRKSGFLLDAKISYLCSANNNSTEVGKVIPIMNLAIVELRLGNTQTARILYELALGIAEKHELASVFAIVENGLGNISLIEKKYPQAQVHFSEALKLNEKLQRRSGEVLSGENLLLSFLYQDKLDLFARLSDRIKRKLKRSQSGSRTAYFAILKAIYEARIDSTKIAASTDTISANMTLLKDKALRDVLAELIGTYGLAWQAEIPIKNEVQRDSLKTLYPMCNWEKFSDDNYISVLISQLAQFQDLKEN
ncbi:tetratricopeptide repeat protein [Aliiglaciecola aliphaticivorans]